MPAPNGSLTTLRFDAVETGALRLTFETPGSYLKISELAALGEPPARDTSPAIAASAEVRCAAERAFVAIRAKNEDVVAVDIALVAPYGSRTIRNVAPGASAYQSFATRLPGTDELAVRVTASAVVDGDPLTLRQDLSTEPVACDGPDYATSVVGPAAG